MRSIATEPKNAEAPLTRSLYVGRLPHLLLSVACATPLSARELLARVERRYGYQDMPATNANSGAQRLRERRWLRQVGTRTTSGLPSPLYVLTPAGEALLDELAPYLSEHLGAVS